MRIPAFALLVPILLSLGACERAPTTAQLVGNYSGTLAGVSDSLSITDDGRFTQILTMPSGETITGSGTWKLTHKAVDLTGYQYFYDQIEEKRVTPYSTTIRFVWGADMLIRDWDTGYYTLRHQ